MALEGQLVRLREERPEDMLPLVQLRNDLETQAWSKTLPPDYTERMYQKRFDERSFSFDRSDARFIIEEKQTGELAGTILYSGLESRFAAIVGIMVAKKFWGTGIAASTTPSFRTSWRDTSRRSGPPAPGIASSWEERT